MKLKAIALTMVLLLTCLACGGRKTDSRFGRDSPDFIMNEGFFLLNQGDLDQAEKKLLTALRKNPQLYAAHNALGIIYSFRRDFPAALKHFKMTIKLNSDFIDAYNSMGMVYCEMGDYKLARENLQIAAAAPGYQTPENALVNLALLEIRLEDWDAALNHIEKGLAVNDRYAPLYNLKGSIIENRGRFEEAVQYYEKALSLLSQPEPEYLFNLGRANYRKGDRNKALDCLNKAMEASRDELLTREISNLIKTIRDGRQ